MVQTPELRGGRDPWLVAQKPEIYMSMLETAETVAERYSVSRKVQDDYALQFNSAPMPHKKRVGLMTKSYR